MIFDLIEVVMIIGFLDFDFFLEVFEILIGGEQMTQDPEASERLLCGLVCILVGELDVLVHIFFYQIYKCSQFPYTN